MEPKHNHKLPYGEGSFFYSEKRGLWIGTIEAGLNERGKRRRIEVSSRDEDAAWDKLQVKRKTLHLQGRAAALQGTKTVKAWAEDWLKVQETRLKPGSYNGAASYMRKWVIPAIGRVQLQDLTANHVRKVQRAVIEAGRSSTTAGTIQSVLQKMLRDARIEGYQVSDAALDVPKPRKSDTRNRQAPSLPETRELASAAEKWPGGVRWIVAIVQGMRPAEVLGLRWDAVDFERGLVDVSWQLKRLPYRKKKDPSSGFRVPDDYEVEQLEGAWHLVRPKSRAGKRLIPLVPYVADLLRTWKTDQEGDEHVADHGLVFPRHDGRPQLDYQDRADWRALQDHAKVWKKKGHGETPPTYWEAYELRRATATLLLAEGVDPKIVKAIMGHSDILVTQGYQDVDEQMMHLALERVSRKLRGQDDSKLITQ